MRLTDETILNAISALSKNQYVPSGVLRDIAEAALARGTELAALRRERDHLRDVVETYSHCRHAVPGCTCSQDADEALGKLTCN